MRNAFRISAAVIGIAFSTTALAKGPSPEFLRSLDFGEAPRDPLESAKPLFDNELKDPSSAQYRLLNTFTGYCKQGWARGNGLDWVGYAANIAVNAKNSYGGYTGYQVYTVLFVNGRAVRLIEGENFGGYGPSRGLLGGGAGVCQPVG